MSNDKFWEHIAAGNSGLVQGMDTFLRVPDQVDAFESVRALTDLGRKAAALALPVPEGTKVVFAGGLGAVISYEDVPPTNMVGEVVAVRSASGAITSHEGVVFVKWADGVLRPIQAEHLRIAPAPKTASKKQSAREEINPYALKMTFEEFKRDYFNNLEEDPPSNRMAREFWDDFKYAFKGSLAKYKKETTEDFSKYASKGSLSNPTGSRKASKQPWIHMSEEDRMKAARYWTVRRKAASNARAVLDVDKAAARDGLVWVGSKYAADTFDATRHVMMSRVASLGDLTNFLKLADGSLVHKSTRDLWSCSKDANGNFVVERLFDDNGEPLKA